MARSIEVVNENGRGFNVSLVGPGEAYGPGGLTNDGAEALVEFYDTGSRGVAGSTMYPNRFAESGQFVARYYLSTLLARDPLDRAGLCLQGDVPAWTIDAPTMATVYRFLERGIDRDKRRFELGSPEGALMESVVRVRSAINNTHVGLSAGVLAELGAAARELLDSLESVEEYDPDHEGYHLVLRAGVIR